MKCLVNCGSSWDVASLHETLYSHWCPVAETTLYFNGDIWSNSPTIKAKLRPHKETIVGLELAKVLFLPTPTSA
jgi:hypothetical protein